jgi:site-specific recombinase XerD
MSSSNPQPARAPRASQPRRCRPGDRWQGLSGDAIERFADIAVLERWLPGPPLWQADLVALDQWCQRVLGRTLISAHPHELRRYIKDLTAGDVTLPQACRIIATLRCFYRYLRDFGYRDDDASRRLPHDSTPLANLALRRLLQSSTTSHTVITGMYAQGIEDR